MWEWTKLLCLWSQLLYRSSSLAPYFWSWGRIRQSKKFHLNATFTTAHTKNDCIYIWPFPYIFHYFAWEIHRTTRFGSTLEFFFLLHLFIWKAEGQRETASIHWIFPQIPTTPGARLGPTKSQKLYLSFPCGWCETVSWWSSWDSHQTLEYEMLESKAVA